eukprot:3587187-Pleurochrysis_carterae.AAC.4
MNFVRFSLHAWRSPTHATLVRNARLTVAAARQSVRYTVALDWLAKADYLGGPSCTGVLLLPSVSALKHVVRKITVRGAY